MNLVGGVSTGYKEEGEKNAKNNSDSEGSTNKPDDKQKQEEEATRNRCNQQLNESPLNPGGAPDGTPEDNYDNLSEKDRKKIEEVRDKVFAAVTPGIGYKAEGEKNPENNSLANGGVRSPSPTQVLVQNLAVHFLSTQDLVQNLAVHFLSTQDLVQNLTVHLGKQAKRL